MPKAEMAPTPTGSDSFFKMYRKDLESKEFAKRIMEPMPLIVDSKGPRDASRHWDWKAGGELGIVTPVKIEKNFGGIKADMIIIDEVAEMTVNKWRDIHLAKIEEGILEGAYTTTVAEDSVLTEDVLNESMKKLGDSLMGSRKKRIPKKKVVRSDPRKAKYNGRMFGNILLSNTQQIENNTTLNDALVIEGVSNTTVEELIAPLFDEFIHKHGGEWQVIGAMSLAAQSVESGKWKNVSALGGEILHFHSAVIGKRDGVCIKWTTGNIVGLDEEMMIDTTIKGFGDKLVRAGVEGNPANRATLIDILLNFAGEADVVTAAEESKERVRVAVAAQIKEDIDRKSEACGESFGSWA